MRNLAQYISRLFSVRQLKRRQGGKALTASMQMENFAELTATPLVEKDLEHLPEGKLGDHLRKEAQSLMGQPKLLFYHVQLIVMLRRGIAVEQNYAQFRELWQSQCDFLCQSLSLRWLISACDTFIDHDENLAIKATMMNAVVMVNTVKLYETERWLQGENAVDYPQEKLQALKEKKQPLFSGLETFTVGQDDTLINMKHRMQVISEQEPLLKLPLCVLERLSQESSVYARFLEKHHHQRTRWL